MLSEIQISHFRGISDCKIEGLKRINIFIGRNNQGKSSILEALYLASGAFSLAEPTGGNKDKINSLLNRRSERGLNWNNGRETLWYRYDMSVPIEINCRWEKNEPLKILLQRDHPHPLIIAPRTATLENLLRNYSIKNPSSATAFCLIDKSIIANETSYGFDPSIINELLLSISNLKEIEQSMENMLFVDTGLLHNVREVEKAMWSKLLRERKDKLITTVLREGYEIQAEDLTYVPIANEYQLAVKLPTTTVRVDDLGDGARFSLILSMAAALAQGTVLLLEEPETHQHPAGLIKSVEVLLSMVEKNDLQVFATSHSLDFIRIIESLAKKQKIDIAIFFVEMKDEGKIEHRLITAADSENLQKLGFDMRFLDIL